MKILMSIFLSLFGYQLIAQTILWKDSLSSATVYFRIDESEFKEHRHRTSPKFDVIESSPSRHKEILYVINTALRKYPPSVLNENIEKVYVYDQFDKGNKWMGTYLGRHGFFFAVPYKSNGDVDTLNFERVIHHEFSHRLFMFNLKYFDNKSWKANNGLKYGEIKSYDRHYKPELYSKAFLHEYAVLNRLEDFTSFAENMFIADPVFWQAINSHQGLKNKFEIVCKFYESINPALNRAYFLQYNTE